ncbi:MAG: hypothetical protein U1F52_00120 [Burkholderiales bacterium]
MRTYTTDSPEALARVIAMTMITDAKLDDRELEIMETLYLYDVLGITRESFSAIVQAYCDDLMADGTPNGRIDIMDRARINCIVDAVQDPKKRLQTAQMIANVIRADGHLHDTELALFRHVLERWHLTLDQLKGIVRMA